MSFPEDHIDEGQFPLVHRAARSARLLALDGKTVHGVRATYEFLGMFDPQGVPSSDKYLGGYNFSLNAPNHSLIGGYLYEFVEHVRELLSSSAPLVETPLLGKDEIAGHLVFRHLVETATRGVLTLDGMRLSWLLAEVTQENPGGYQVPGGSSLGIP